MQNLSEILSPERTLCRVSGGSKKRLFETIAELISENQQELASAEIFSQLIARERLGSTGFGKGIAIPHCRIANCPEPLGSLLSLDEAIEYEAPDNQPVDLLFVLLVPEEAQQTHLDILARVAGLFGQEAFCQALREATDAGQLYQLMTSWSA
ncbi:MAG: PTS IIA-like nitrogen regulatory protein PtsN [Parahaliea sp.]